MRSSAWRQVYLYRAPWSRLDHRGRYDPANPKVAKHIPGPDNTFTIQMELHDNLMITAMRAHVSHLGRDVDKPFDKECSSGTSAIP